MHIPRKSDTGPDVRLLLAASSPVCCDEHIGFTAIQLHDYVELHVRANPDAECAEVIKQLESTIDAYRAGARCQCGDSIWIIGSARAGLGCFTCIAEQTNPDHDYEVDDLRGAAPVVDTTSRFVAQGGSDAFESVGMSFRPDRLGAS